MAMRGSIVKGFRVGCVLLASMASAGPVLAQERPPVCAAPVALTGDLAAWASPGDRTAATDVAGLAAATLAIGEAARVKLLPTPAVRYPLRPEKPGGSVSFGGLVRLHVTAPGTYRIALGSGRGSISWPGAKRSSPPRMATGRIARASARWSISR
jgi:hypothetical protein